VFELNSIAPWELNLKYMLNKKSLTAQLVEAMGIPYMEPD
jgi:hypothetical protein